MTAFRVFLLTLCSCSLPAWAQESTPWLSGKKLEQAAKRSPIFVNWQQVPLHSQLHALSRNLQIAILLDRRVDPSQLVDRQDRDLTFEQFLWALASPEKLAVCQVGDLFYLGPEATALALPEDLKRLNEQLAGKDLSTKLKQKLTEKINVSVSQPFEPSLWLAEDAARADLPLLNPEEFPMDWWAPLDWPTMPRIQAYTLFAASFGLSLQIEEAGLRFVPTQLPEALSREYSWSAPQNLSLADLRQQHPQLTLDLQKDKLTASGPATAFGNFERQLGCQSRSTPKESGERRFTLNKTKAPRGSILATIAQQLGLKLMFPEEARAALSERIEVDVQQVTLQELMEKVLADTGLSYEMVEGEFRIIKKP